MSRFIYTQDDYEKDIKATIGFAIEAIEMGDLDAVKHWIPAYVKPSAKSSTLQISLIDIARYYAEVVNKGNISSHDIFTYISNAK